MNANYAVVGIENAWNLANDLFPTDYIKDDERSANAGYPVYYSTADGVNAWISDLGCCLELNLPDGTSININIKVKEYSESELAETLEIVDDALYAIDDKISNKLINNTHLANARKELYATFADIYHILQREYPNSKLIDRYNLTESE